MSGTTRTIAYWNGLRGAPTVGLLDERTRRLEPVHEVRDVGAALRGRTADHRVARQPQVWHVLHDVADRCLVELRRKPGVGFLDRPGIGQQHVVADALEGTPGMGLDVTPRVVHVQ